MTCPGAMAWCSIFETAKASATGHVPFDDLRNDPVNHMPRGRAAEAVAAYLEKASNRNDHQQDAGFATGTPPSTRPQPQTRLLSLGGNRGGVGSEGHEGLSWGYGEDWGLSASGPVDMGRYIAVAPA